ncbi:MAG: response regulator transcription factor [bacterium]|nr:response regulator transcription factor [bacterium]
MSRVLIIEDEIKLRNQLKIFLENNDFEVKILDDYDDITNFINNEDIDIILLDIVLPGMDGMSMCKKIRKVSDIPIIMVTSKNNQIDELISINYGADDFITKPYNPQILLARIQRLLKRTNTFVKTIHYKNMKLDINKSSILCNDIVIDLSKNEIRCLYYLLKNRGKIVSRDELINYLWDECSFIDDNTLTVNITRVRNKLSLIGLNNVIITKKNQGYIIL